MAGLMILRQFPAIYGEASVAVIPWGNGPQDSSRKSTAPEIVTEIHFKTTILAFTNTPGMMIATSVAAKNSSVKVPVPLNNSSFCIEYLSNFTNQTKPTTIRHAWPAIITSARYPNVTISRNHTRAQSSPLPDETNLPSRFQNSSATASQNRFMSGSHRYSFSAGIIGIFFFILSFTLGKL